MWCTYKGMQMRLHRAGRRVGNQWSSTKHMLWKLSLWVGENVCACETDLKYGGKQSSGRKLSWLSLLWNDSKVKKKRRGDCNELQTPSDILTRNHKHTMKSNVSQRGIWELTKWHETDCRRILMTHSVLKHTYCTRPAGLPNDWRSNPVNGVRGLIPTAIYVGRVGCATYNKGVHMVYKGGVHDRQTKM